jgi:L-ascorbate metabolism protein UlaG (beta-lactamase superfamily)
MRITKFGHACVRIETGEQVIVLDPGGFTEPEAVDGATAVLITHEHPDHYSADNLRRTDAPIHTIGDVAAVIREQAPDLGERISVVAPGQSVDVGVPATAVGEDHAVIHPDIPRIHNSGFLLEVEDTRIYHPGDALTLPDGEIDLLLLPVSAPWLKVGECIDFARASRAPRLVAIHDKIYSDLGLGLVGNLLGGLLDEHEQTYTRVEPGQDV